MALRRLSCSHLARLRPTAVRSLVTAPFLHDTDDLARSRDRETADEETFERPFYCIKSNALPPWPRKTVELVEISHTRFVYVCESGLLQHALAQGPKTVRKYVQECRDLHFDAVEVPDACANMLPEKDYLLLLDDLQKAGLKPRPKIGIWHAGGAAKDHGYLRERAFDRGAMSTATDAILKAKRCLERGAEQVTVDNLSIPGEHAGQWQERVVRRLVDELGLSKLMFEAPHPEEILDFKVFTWFVNTIGPEVNLHVDFTQVVHLQCLQRGVLYPPPVSLAYTGMPPDDDSDSD